MRLFTHNFLQCHVKGCTTDNFPLQLTDASVVMSESEYNSEFIRGYLNKIDYPAVLTAITELNLNVVLPSEMPEDPSEDFLTTLHSVLFKYSVRDGKMVCRGCGHIYIIKDGIPNLLLSEDEI